MAYSVGASHSLVSPSGVFTPLSFPALPYLNPQHHPFFHTPQPRLVYRSTFMLYTIIRHNFFIGRVVAQWANQSPPEHRNPLPPTDRSKFQSGLRQNWLIQVGGREMEIEGRISKILSRGVFVGKSPRLWGAGLSFCTF